MLVATLQFICLTHQFLAIDVNVCMGEEKDFFLNISRPVDIIPTNFCYSVFTLDLDSERFVKNAIKGPQFFKIL